jgi:IS5 family transposase
MSIDISAIHYPIKEKLQTKVNVPVDHFLITLATIIPWMEYAELAIADLYKNKKKSGRKLNLRLHIGAFLLQTLFRWTDRELEENLNYYAPAKIFCGIESKSYDHSAYVKFRNRLSEDTAKQFNVQLLKRVHKRGFTGTQFMDFDSTVQEANIEYPADIRMMQSIFQKGVKVLKGLSEAGSHKAENLLKEFDIKKISKDFKAYFFAKKSESGRELKQKLFSNAHKIASKMTSSIEAVMTVIKNYDLPWNYERDLEQLTSIAPQLLKQIKHFIRNGEVASEKILSLHAREVKCIAKGKAGKPFEFGRKFFIGRLPGNYAYTFTDEDFALEDAKSLEKGLKNYIDIFGEYPQSISGDQGFWSRPNLKACESCEEVGITPRGHKNWKVDPKRAEEVQVRRAKVEPIIGHLKRRGMGKSKMKSDKMTKLDGQRSALSLNLTKVARDMSQEKLE